MNKLEIVQHPAGGSTLAVPIAPDSTVRIYVGCWGGAPRRSARRGVVARKNSGRASR